MLLETINTLAPNSPSAPTSLGVAILSAYVMDYLKRFKNVPKVTYYSNKLNSWLRLAIAGIGTLGISYAWTSVGSAGTHQLVLNIPAWSAVGAGLYHWAFQYGVQHMGEIVLSKRDVAVQAAAAQAVAPKA